MRFLSALTPWALFFLDVFAANNFQVQLDQKAANSGYWVMSTILPLTQPDSTITPDILAGLARDAWQQMQDGWTPARKAWIASEEAAAKAAGRPKNAAGRNYPPYVMTALLADSKIYLSSSITGGGGTPFLLNIDARSPEDPQLNQALSRCLMTLETTSFDANVRAHSNSASCGEMTCLRQWDISTENAALDGLAGMIVTVSQPPGMLLRIMAPCSPANTNRGRYGCQQVIGKTALTEVPVGTTFPAVTPDISFGTPQQEALFC